MRRFEGHVMLVLVYVDDVIFTYSGPSQLQEFFTILNKQSSLKDMGTLHYFLGVEANHSFQDFI